MTFGFIYQPDLHIFRKVIQIEIFKLTSKAAQLIIEEEEQFKEFTIKEMEKFLMQGKTTKLLSKVLSS